MPAQVDKVKCIGCEACVGICPVEAIEMQGDKAFVKQDVCIDCGACPPECPVDAISMV